MGKTDSAMRTIPADSLREWFGNSVAIDPSGLPLVLYHGATSGDMPHARDMGIWFSSSPEIASAYVSARSEHMKSKGQIAEGNVVPAFLKIENPMIVDANGSRWDEIEIDDSAYTTDDLIQMALVEGHDGLIVQNVNDLGGVVDNDDEYPLSTTYAVFNQSQFQCSVSKSASLMFSSDRVNTDNYLQVNHHRSDVSFLRYEEKKFEEPSNSNKVLGVQVALSGDSRMAAAVAAVDLLDKIELMNVGRKVTA